MKYFWIVVIIAVILSPIIGLRSSPRQKKLEKVRRLASSDGISVQLSRRPDARDDERALDSISYRLPWGLEQPGQIRPWTLTCNGARGMEAEWAGWRWFEGPAPKRLEPVLGAVIAQFPEGTTGLVVDSAGVALHWDESGDEQEVQAIVEGLKELRSAVLDGD